jgi:catechol 2,3-dioxygenase-like lactoylglutathione lyase family enzyme
MQISRLDHVNVRTKNLKEMIDWYDRILGLKTGARPDFVFPGAWVYVGNQAAIHLVGTDKDCAAIEPKIEHFAFSATGLRELVEKLTANGIAHSIDEVPGMPLVQVNLADYDGNHIHIDFAVSELQKLKP